MSHAASATTPATFEIKSAVLPLVAVLLKSADLAALAAELSQRWADTPDFFDGDPVVLDLAHLPPPADGKAAPIDFAAVMALLRQWRLEPVAVRGATAAQMQQARAAGLVAATDARDLPPPRAQAAVSAAPAAPAPVAPSSALVIDRPLRSGQQVYARGRDLVVLAMVNAGAEVIADGSIHVYAPLRGKALAGVRGDAEARIFTLGMEPELVSIAGVYRTSETPWPDNVRGKAAQIRLRSGPDGDRLILEALNP